MKLEKVVNPPRMPTKTNVRTCGGIAIRSLATTPASTPMTAAPRRFTVAVAYGTDFSHRCAISRFTQCRAIDPSAPPIATAHHVISHLLTGLDGKGRQEPNGPRVRSP